MQALADLRKSEKEKEFFQEGYIEELEKREKAEGFNSLDLIYFGLPLFNHYVFLVTNLYTFFILKRLRMFFDTQKKNLK